MPQLDGLYEGATHRILVTEAGGVRLVIATVDPGSGTPGARDVAAILASIDFEARARFASRSSSSRSTRRLASFPPARA
ncbi:MAG TPA: hypothetical protein VNL94_08855 [Candidatus Binatia bacterium]|nr:hypothetical protein [Candidatus Binatia bacterium]